MSKLSTSKQLSLGAFVALGVIIAIGVVYYLGTKRQWFGDNISTYTYFNNVSGLQAGNNIRFSGINVGTVERIRLASDSTVLVEMIVSREASGFIKEDSRASIESDGLMGNKVVSISAGSPDAPHIEDGDTLRSRSPASLDQVIASFKTTSDNANELTKNLRDISEKIQNSEGLLGKLLTDSAMAGRFETTLESFRETSLNTERISVRVSGMARDMQYGDGLIPRLLNDSVMAENLSHTMDSLSYASRNLASTSRKLEEFADRLNNEEGAVNLLLTDSIFANDLEKTLRNVKDGTTDLDELVQTVNESWLLNLFNGDKSKEEDKKNKK